MGKRKKFDDDKVKIIDLTLEDEYEDDDDEHQKLEKAADYAYKHRTCWKHTIANLKANKLKIKADIIESYKESSPCILDTFPQRKRSSRPRKRKWSGGRVSKRDARACKTKSGLPKRGVSRRNSMSMKMGSDKFEHYIENLWKGLSEDKMTSFTYLDSLWFGLYMDGRSDVISWIKKKGIFSKKYVFVPIVCWSHWSLLILCHFGESLQSKTKTPCMLLLDSLEMAGPRRLEPEIRKFVLDIYGEEGRSETKDKIYKIPFLVPKVPQQRDDKECGKFVLYYINLFVKAAPENFSIESYPYFMKKDWFTVEGFEYFSKRLDSIPLKSEY